MISHRFQLEKTYLDCIDANGNCFIIYNATIKFLLFKLNYSSLLFSPQSGPTKELTCFKRTAPPVLGDEITLRIKGFCLTGTWTGTGNPIRTVLYKDPKGRELIWNCHHAKTNTQILFDGCRYKGLGYAETISLPLAPQRLPIDELRWGRFLSEHHTIIWINWKGAHPLNKIFCDGTLFEDGLFEENRITFGDDQYEVLFEDPVAVTTRSLSSVFNTLPLLKIFFSKRVLDTRENKYKARSTFTSPVHGTGEGFALFETVIFGK